MKRNETRSFRSMEEKVKLLEAYQQSGLKVSEFCREREVSIHSFRKWLQAEKISAIKHGTAFIPVPRAAVTITREPLIVCYGNYEIKVPESYGKEQLARLLDVLEARDVH